jgi:uncharacterized protein (TIRG00374 family)
MSNPENPGEGRPTKRKTFIYIGIAIVIGLVTNIFMGLLMDGSKIWRSVSTVSVWLIILPFCAYIGVSLVDSLRLYLVSRRCGHPLSLRNCVLNSMVGAFFAHVTPLAMGGQPFQIVHLAHHGMTKRMATNIIFSRFVVNAMLLVLLLVIGLPVVISIFGSVTGLAIFFYLGLAVTILFALFFLLILIQPHIVSWMSARFAHTALGRAIGRATRKPDWQAEFEVWTRELRAEIRFLWSEGLWTMVLDILLNVIDLLLLAFALWYPLVNLVDPGISFLQVLVIYNAVWQVVFYVPSPGASGGLEGMFTLVFTGMTGKAEMTLVAVVIWRFSTYYLSLIPGILLSSVAFRRTETIPPKAGREAAV